LLQLLIFLSLKLHDYIAQKKTSAGRLVYNTILGDKFQAESMPEVIGELFTNEELSDYLRHTFPFSSDAELPINPGIHCNTDTNTKAQHTKPNYSKPKHHTFASNAFPEIWINTAWLLMSAD